MLVPMVPTSLFCVIKFEAQMAEMNRILWITRITGVARSCSTGASDTILTNAIFVGLRWKMSFAKMG